MDPPELPGFYYDREKRRYFLITNGDQRINNPYTNNAIRAKERQELYQSKKRRVATKKRDPRLTDFGDQFLRVKLGLQSPLYLFHHILSDYVSLHELSDYSVWPGFDNNTCFTVEGSILRLYQTSHNGKKLETPCYTHSLFPHFEVDPSVDSYASKITTCDGWVFVQFGKLFSVTKWKPSENLKYDVIDYTERIKLEIASYANRCGFLGLAFATGELQQGFLYLLLLSGSLATFDLTRGKTKHMRSMYMPLESIVPNGLQVCCSVWGFYSGKVLTLVKYGSPDRVCITFESQIYFADLAASPRVSSCGRTLDLIVVTQKNVSLRHVDIMDLKKTSVDQTVSIHNDNQSLPLVYKDGDYIIVEELPTELKVINFALGLVELQTIEVLASRTRAGMPRLVTFGEHLFWSDSKSSLVYT